MYLASGNVPVGLTMVVIRTPTLKFDSRSVLRTKHVSPVFGFFQVRPTGRTMWRFNDTGGAHNNGYVRRTTRKHY
jgi:hypothetical protein